MSSAEMANPKRLDDMYDVFVDDESDARHRRESGYYYLYSTDGKTKAINKEARKRRCKMRTMHIVSERRATVAIFIVT
jgi:hypothetical protein